MKNALRIPIAEVHERLKVCESKCDYFQRHDGHWYRRKFLERLLLVSRIKRNAKAEKQILEIIEREKQSTFWRQLNYAMQKKGGCSFRSIQIQTDERPNHRIHLPKQSGGRNLEWKLQFVKVTCEENLATWLILRRQRSSRWKLPSTGWGHTSRHVGSLWWNCTNPWDYHKGLSQLTH
jgi:hypothetical protein